MSDLTDMIWIEWRKATRSRVPLLTTLGFLIAPLACALLMFVYKDPEFARKAGLISTKANLIGGSADWPFFLNMLAQAIAIGGFVLFSLVEGWVFGREFADDTLKDLLAVPVARSTILLAKFCVAGLWSAAMAGIVCLVGLVLGALIGLPQGSAGVFVQGSLTLLVTTGLVTAVVTPIALFASIGRGYLAPLGAAFLLLILAQVMGVLGWGSLFPWAIPALYSNLAGKGAAPGPLSFWIVLLTGLSGVIGTDLWWRLADQKH